MPEGVPRARRTAIPGGHLPPWRRTARAWLARLVVSVLLRALIRVRVQDGSRLPPGPAVLCFNHLNWIDPFLLMAALPLRPRLYFFGPREADMRVGWRNRLMTWTGTAVPYRPGKDNLLTVSRSVSAVLASGGWLAIAGEGKIHPGESVVLPLDEGAAYFALRARVPLVPVAINGTSQLGFGRRLQVTIGEPLETAGRPDRRRVRELTADLQAGLERLVRDAADPPPAGRFGRWLTELFNEWPPDGPAGARPSR